VNEILNLGWGHEAEPSGLMKSKKGTKLKLNIQIQGGLYLM